MMIADAGVVGEPDSAGCDPQAVAVVASAATSHRLLVLPTSAVFHHCDE
ncbi:MAG: hypothetical protein QM733_06695 [Ilumatobacteraceae bacterium]